MLVRSSGQTVTSRSPHGMRYIRALPMAILLLAALILTKLTIARAEAQTGEPIGILLAAGDIAGCRQTGSKHAEVAARFQKEIDLVQPLPVGILALGDLAYAHYARDKKTKKKAPVPGTYAECFES